MEVAALEEFLRDPWTVRVGDGGGDGEGTVQVRVPRVLPQQKVVRLAAEDGTGREKRAALQREAAASSVAAEDYVRRLEIGAADVVSSIFPLSRLFRGFLDLVVQKGAILIPKLQSLSDFVIFGFLLLRIAQFDCIRYQVCSFLLLHLGEFRRAA